MDSRTIALIGLYTFTAFVIYVCLAIPPGTGWDRNVHWGDVATWVGAFASFAAVATALRLSGAEARRRLIEQAEKERNQALRVSLLLHPVFAHLMAVLSVVPSRIDSWTEGRNGNLADIEDETGLAAIRGVAEQIELAGEIPPVLAVNVLSTLGWCRTFERSVHDAFSRKVMQYMSGSIFKIGERYVLENAEDGRRQLGYAITALKAFAEAAYKQTDEILGDSIALPVELFAKFRTGGNRT